MEISSSSYDSSVTVRLIGYHQKENKIGTGIRMTGRNADEEDKIMKRIKRLFVWLFTPVAGVPMDPCAAYFYGVYGF